MYRDDQEAALQRAETATRENDQLKRENEAMRQALVQQPSAPPTYAMMQPTAIYPHLDPRFLPLPERARLAQHTLRPFSPVAAVILNFITFGLFGFFYYSAKHDRMPVAATNDPSAGKAIGFQFIPYFNLYWMFFNNRRLCDRLDLQLRLRGLPNAAPKGLATAACILTLIPYIGWAIAWLFLWPIVTARLQSTINRVAALPPTQFDATLLPAPAYGVPMTPYGMAAPPPPTWR